MNNHTIDKVALGGGKWFFGTHERIITILGQHCLNKQVLLSLPKPKLESCNLEMSHDFHQLRDEEGIMANIHGETKYTFEANFQGYITNESKAEILYLDNEEIMRKKDVLNHILQSFSVNDILLALYKIVHEREGQ